MFCSFVSNTVYSPARVVLDDVRDSEDEEAESSEDYPDESSDEESDLEVVVPKIKIGSMVKVQSPWEDDVKEWYLGKVVEFAPGEWIKIHYWRSYSPEEDRGRIYSPVWQNKKKNKEVYMLNPKSQGGFKGASPCDGWLSPMKDAVLAVARCIMVKKGVIVREWCEDFNF